MKLRVTDIEWSYDNYDSIPESEIWDLEQIDLSALLSAFGNGIFLEIKIEADCIEALCIIKNVIKKIANAKPIDLTEEQMEVLWLYESGYTVFQQGKNAFIFLYPEVCLDF